MQVFEIPVSAVPQKLHISLSGADYTLSTVWNTVAQLWVLDIGDTTETPIVRGIPLVTGSDLLAQYRYLDTLPPGVLNVASDGEPDTTPTFDNLGVTSHLYYIVQ